jgi:hypothetical protein
LQYILTYKKQIDSVKNLVEKTEESVKALKSFFFSNKEIEKYKKIVENRKKRKNIAIWKRYLLDEEYKIHKVLKQRAKNIDDYLKEVKYYKTKVKGLQKEINQLEIVNEATKNLKEEAETNLKKIKIFNKII